MFAKLALPGGGLFDRLKSGLRKTQEKLALGLQEVFRGRTRVDASLYEELERVLLEGDLGLVATERLLGTLEKRVRAERIEDPATVRSILKEEIEGLLRSAAHLPSSEPSPRPLVCLVAGVNGVGKTTTIGKLAAQHVREGRSVVLCAGDTFRAAAAEQLAIWAERAGARLVRHREGADPAAVVYDALDTAVARHEDVILIDTAGRLHTKDNLMTELEKIRRVLSKRLPGAPHETLLVLDATTGQNALVQAREFASRIGITGLVVTKLDGTAKGGVIAGIVGELRIPVVYVGTGEAVEDLIAFDPSAFADALFS